jgi:hypothetical protein
VKTVNKYWNVDAEGFAEVRQKGRTRNKKLRGYEETVLGWLQQFPEISAAQVTDWLEEHYHDKTVRERTARRMVTRLRKERHIDNKPATRQYQAVEDPPMGKQLQVDFGEAVVRRGAGGHCKIYAMGAVLSHSRYKYGKWSEKPLTTTMFIQMLRHCFDYLGAYRKNWFLIRTSCLPSVRIMGISSTPMNLRSSNRRWGSRSGLRHRQPKGAEAERQSA